MEIAIRQGVFTDKAMVFLRHLEGLLQYGELLTLKERKSICRFMEQMMIPTADCESVRLLDTALVDFLLHFDKPLAQEQTVEIKVKKPKRTRKKSCPRCTHKKGYTGPHKNCVLR